MGKREEQIEKVRKKLEKVGESGKCEKKVDSVGLLLRVDLQSSEASAAEADEARPAGARAERAEAKPNSIDIILLISYC